MIEITNLSRTYSGNVKALDEINLTIGPGMFGLIGPNGAGKTSLMRILAGLMRPTEGNVRVFGHDLATPQGRLAAKSLLGYLPQELGFYPTLNGREFLDYIAVLKGVTDRTTRRQQIEELLELVRLSEVAHRKLKTYSGGMKRRIGIAQALLGSPRFLIMDEPTVGLDPEERVRLRNLLSDMAKRCTVIFSTHIVEDISQSCQKLAMLYKGQVIFHGAPLELINQARGHVWTLTGEEDLPSSEVAVVSSLQLQNGVQYRVVGEPPTKYLAQPVEPSLEDGYIWMIRQVQAKVMA